MKGIALVAKNSGSNFTSKSLFYCGPPNSAWPANAAIQWPIFLWHHFFRACLNSFSAPMSATINFLTSSSCPFETSPFLSLHSFQQVVSVFSLAHLILSTTSRLICSLSPYKTPNHRLTVPVLPRFQTKAVSSSPDIFDCLSESAPQ